MNVLLYNTIIKPINMVSEKLFDFCFCYCCGEIYIGQIDKHQHFSLNKNNIRLKLKSNKQPLDMPIKGVAFSSDLISADS